MARLREFYDKENDTDNEGRTLLMLACIADTTAVDIQTVRYLVDTMCNVVFLSNIRMTYRPTCVCAIALFDACLRARVPACPRARVPACLRACVPACLRAFLFVLRCMRSHIDKYN